MQYLQLGINSKHPYFLLKNLKARDNIKIRDENGIPRAYPRSRLIPGDFPFPTPRKFPGPVCLGTGRDPWERDMMDSPTFK